MHILNIEYLQATFCDLQRPPPQALGRRKLFGFVRKCSELFTPSPAHPSSVQTSTEICRRWGVLAEVEETPAALLRLAGHYQFHDQAVLAVGAGGGLLVGDFVAVAFDPADGVGGAYGLAVFAQDFADQVNLAAVEF